MRSYVRSCRAKGLKIGLVPTMGFLHQGHLSLIEIARSSCDIVVVSIFVNPTQFGPGEDLGRYPRDVEGDLTQIAQAGAEVAFLPSADEIYDGGSPVHVSIPDLSRRFCGISRPHHFDGVCQVVLKLFGLIKCDVAVFGEKDFQQLAIIRRLVSELYLDVEILAGPIVRAPSGVAMSSRNVNLTTVEESQSRVLIRALKHARSQVALGVTDPMRLRTEMIDLIEGESETTCEYVEIVDPRRLEQLAIIHPDRGARALVAVQFSATRLIDNLSLTNVNS